MKIIFDALPLSSRRGGGGRGKMQMDIKTYIRTTLKDFIKSKGLDKNSVKIIIERPKDEGNGDFSTNLAMVISKQLKKNPKEVAAEICDFINHLPPSGGGWRGVEKTQTAGPGFINLWINDNYYRNVLSTILNESVLYGKLGINSGKTANLEWVSANPTGPLHLGHGRQVSLGKAVANLLEWSGYDVTREYYYNDAGQQMENLTKSVYARYRGLFEPEFPFPGDGYVGDYVIEIAKLLQSEYGDKLVTDPDNEVFRKAGENFCFKSIKNTLHRFGIEHDVFFNESSLYDSGKIKETLEEFSKKGLSYEKESAIWLKTSELLKDKKDAQDKVIVKSSGAPTYRLPDMAYHIDKIKRGFDSIVDIFGADHGDTYKEVLAGVAGLGYDPSKIKVIIHQMVTFVQDGSPVKMSKRSGNVYELDDLLDDVGEDVAQFFFVMRSANTHLDFDIGLAKEQSDKNPVFYLQYAHARICGILRNAVEVFPDYNKAANIDFNLLKEKEELDLMKALSLFPDAVEGAYKTLEPHKIITYLNEAAENYHKFYHNHRVINKENPELSYARLKLCEAARIVLRNGFEIIGIKAPEKM